MANDRTMQAVVKPAAAPGAEIREVPVPEIGADDVLVKVRAASICGTDLHIYNWDEWAQHRIKPPLVPGHEFCGYVAAVGQNVTSVKEGDFVSAEMHVACGKCFQCRIGERHICQNVRILGVDGPGAFAEYVRIPESNIWQIDGAIPEDYASLFDPLGNAVHTVLAGEIAGMSCAVIGCGPIGLFAIAVARACGAGEIFAIEPNAYRRGLARAMKADHVLDPAKDDVKQFVLDHTHGTGVDVIIEMSGNARAIQQGFQIVRMGGRVSLLGIPAHAVELNLAEDIIFKGAVVQGINGRLVYKTWYQMQALLKTGKLDLDPVITDRMPLSDFTRAMEKLKSGAGSKIIVYPDGQERRKAIGT